MVGSGDILLPFDSPAPRSMVPDLRYSILMRQSCTILERNKILIIFILATIIFTYGYEGVVSSLLTVPPPVKTFKTLGELLDNGYKLIGYDPNGNDSYLRQIFSRENITKTFQEAIVKDPRKSLTVDQKIESMAQCNIGTILFGSTMVLNYCRNTIQELYPGTTIKCYSTLGTVVHKEVVYHVLGNYHDRLTRTLARMSEAGLLDMYQRITNFMYNALVSTATQREEIIINSALVPFKLSDWRILSIFIIWAILLGMTLVTLLLEYWTATKIAIQ